MQLQDFTFQNYLTSKQLKRNSKLKNIMNYDKQIGTVEIYRYGNLHNSNINGLHFVFAHQLLSL